LGILVFWGLHKMPGASTGTDLSSWKEIASYLGVSVKTAQMWERDRGLPVRRAPGGRSRVSASLSDLELWKTAPVALPKQAHSRFAPWLLAGILTGVLGGLAIILFFPRLGPVAEFRIDHRALVVLDGHGREAWRHEFDSTLATWAYGDLQPRRIWIGALDGPAVVFLRIPAGEGVVQEDLWCFDAKGKIRWHFVPDRTVRTATRSFHGPWSVHAFTVATVGNQPRVFVTSHDQESYPDQVSMLSPSGKVLREYWHAGQLTTLYVGSVENKTRIFLNGINNARHTGTLVVLDPNTFQGASHEDSPAYQFQGLPPGTEIARFLFPRSCINQRFEAYNEARGLLLRPTGFSVTVHERLNPPNYASILYEFDNALRLTRVMPSDSFLALHHQLQADQVLDHAFTVAERDRLGVERIASF
jgi:hypothetical protein